MLHAFVLTVLLCGGHWPKSHNWHCTRGNYVACSETDNKAFLIRLFNIFIVVINIHKIYYKTSSQKPPCAMADASLNPICSQIDSNDILWSGGYILSALSQAWPITVSFLGKWPNIFLDPLCHLWVLTLHILLCDNFLSIHHPG